MKFELVGVTVENLRGFTKASLSLERPVTLLVGANNSGKTSLLRLLEWAMSGVDVDLLEGRRELTTDELELLVPARVTRSRARRLTLHVQVNDGRRRRRFEADRNDVSHLRLRIVGDAVYAAVTKPKRSESNRSEDAAVDLLQELQSSLLVRHVPAARDASSARFDGTVSQAIRARLEERALHDSAGGAPAEYRRIRKAVNEVTKIADRLVEPLWDDLSAALPSGLVTSGQFHFEASPTELVDWLIERATFRISTGEHDESRVHPWEVGSGLQSLLDLGMLETDEPIAQSEWLLLEEPEAFLHPAAQRQIAQKVLRKQSVCRIVSTHSSIIIDEAEYGQVVLLRDHQVYEPKVDDQRRADINTALMAGNGAEAMFSESVLFVEGPGDRAFFDALRSRLAEVDDTGRVHKLGLVDVGGKQRFAPWVRLLQSYMSSQGELPIQWLAVADGADAAHDLARGLRDAGRQLPLPVSQKLGDLTKVFRDEGAEKAIELTRDLNRAAEESGARLALLPIDLEYVMFELAGPHTVAHVAESIGLGATDSRELMRALGSKVEGIALKDAPKQAWIRALCGRDLPWSEVSGDVKAILLRWLAAVMSPDEARALVASL